MYKSLEIKNLRAIDDLRIDNLGQVNVFVGKNGCGKTTLLEALFFISGATNPQLPINTNIFRGYEYIHKSIWKTFFKNQNISKTIHIEAVYDEQLVALEIKPYFLTGESIDISDITDISKNGKELSFSQNQLFENVNGLSYTYSSPQLRHLYTSKCFLEGEKLKVEGKSQIPVQAVFLTSHYAKDIKDRFGEVQRQKKVSEVIDLLKEIHPKISNLALNELGVLEADIGQDYLIPVQLMGGGMTKYINIALAMLFYQNGVVLIDEIENGLHYSAQGKLWKAIFAWAQKLNIQVFITTHSWECLNAFNEAYQPSLFGGLDARLFRIEREEAFKCIDFTHEDLKTALSNQWEVR